MKLFRKFFEVMQETERAAQIKRIFWFFFWGSLMPIITISAIAYFSGQTILKNQAIESLSAINNVKSDQLDLFIEKLKVRVADWSSDGEIRKDAERIIQGEPLSGSLSSYLKNQKLPIDPVVALVDVLNSDGIVIASSDILRLGKDESKEKISFSKARSALLGEVIFTPELIVEEDELAGVPMLHFASSLKSIKTEKTIGVLLLHLKNDELNKFFTAKEEKTLETYLVNREKLMITPSRFISDAALKQSIDSQPVRACLDHGKDYQGSHLNYRGKQVIGVSKCLFDGLGVIVTEIDVSEAFMSINVFRNILFLVIAIILILTSIYGLWSGKKLLTTTTTATTATTATIIIIGIVFSIFFSKTLEQFIFRVKTDPIFDLIQGQASRYIGRAEYFVDWQMPESQRRFKDFAFELKISLPSVVAIKVFDNQSVLAWSDLVKEKIGQKEEAEDVTGALQGKQKIEIAEKEIQKELGLLNLLEIYTPVYLENKNTPAGVVEIYFDTSDLAIFIRKLQLFIWSIIAVALAIIYGILFLVFRKQNEQIFRQAKELSVIIEKSPYGIYTLNKNGIIDSFNPKMVELAGVKNAEEVIGLNAFELPTYKVVGLDKFFREGLLGKAFTAEVEYASYTGGTTFRHYFGVPIVARDGVVERLLLMVEDITERKKLEKEVKKYTTELEQMVLQRTVRLEEKVAELQKINDLMVGRELKMVELKEKIEKLSKN